MWQVYEDSGANEYATWVWEIYADTSSTRADSPSRYYPGDRYVDWIGLSAYSRSGYRTNTLSLNSIS